MVLLLAVVPVYAPAQQLAPGIWRGTLTIGGANIDVRLTVQGGVPLSATMQASDGPATAVTDLQVRNDELYFTWGSFECDLSVGGAGYRGSCSAVDGTEGRMELTTPSATDAGQGARGSDFLTAEELLATGAPDLFEAVQRTRRRWLDPVRQGGLVLAPAEVQVYLGRQWIGGADALKSYSLENVAQLRYYVPRDAIVRFGSRNQGGVIEIVLR